MGYEILKCFYCGDDATCKDHIIPVSYYYSGKRQPKKKYLTSEYGKENLIDSCNECNNIAWNKIFQDVFAKKEYIQEKIKLKYKKVVNMPFWSEEEINELGYMLKKEIRIQQLARKWILNRMSYPKELYSPIKLNKELKMFLDKEL